MFVLIASQFFSQSVSRNGVRWPSEAAERAFSTAVESHRTPDIDLPPNFG